ncbi:PTS lactose/cellobiose transporter subunit IIA [Caproicibacter sp. BJN0012]|uniref:PTS lactose/cellobiose transporter subunit IIA n=1 Tax=Caproicibacter sp. BJN0012 TaxID=3110227 RepID=UPI002E15AF6E
MEQITMQLIVNSGDARSKAMEAIGIAKNGEISKARKYLEEAKEYLAKAHQFQTDMIQEEADGNVEKITMLMAHAQDHLMNAITVIDLAREFVDLYEKISKHEGKSKVL